MLEKGDLLCLKSNPERAIGLFVGYIGEEILICVKIAHGRLNIYKVKRKDEVEKYEKPKTSA